MQKVSSTCLLHGVSLQGKQRHVGNKVSMLFLAWIIAYTLNTTHFQVCDEHTVHQDWFHLLENLWPAGYLTVIGEDSCKTSTVMDPALSDWGKHRMYLKLNAILDVAF